jgi:hypothetical protein
MPNDELDHLRSLLQNAHQPNKTLGRKIKDQMKQRFTRTKNEPVKVPASSKLKPNAA